MSRDELINVGAEITETIQYAKYQLSIDGLLGQHYEIWQQIERTNRNMQLIVWHLTQQANTTRQNEG